MRWMALNKDRMTGGVLQVGHTFCFERLSIQQDEGEMARLSPWDPSVPALEQETNLIEMYLSLHHLVARFLLFHPRQSAL